MPLPTTEAEPEDDLWYSPPEELPTRATDTFEEGGMVEETNQKTWEEEESWGDAEIEEEGEDWGKANLEEEWTENENGGKAEPAATQGGSAETGLLPEATDVNTALPQTSAPAGTTIATLPATTVWSQAAHQEAQERLTTLLSSMPPNTILVDLRQHSPTPRARRLAASSGPQKLGLSKQLLRTLYGGRYWDRGSVIQTSRCLASTRPPRWGRVVINPDDPEGLGALITALTQGFSLVVLDGEASYAERERAEVLSELRQRVANLHEGSCS